MMMPLYKAGLGKYAMIALCCSKGWSRRLDSCLNRRSANRTFGFPLDPFLCTFRMKLVHALAHVLNALSFIHLVTANGAIVRFGLTSKSRGWEIEMPDPFFGANLHHVT